jgi:predicted DNA binding CopG/RHH family protein
LAKKRVQEPVELHSKPRKMNPDAKKRIAVIIKSELVLKLKIKAYESGQTLQTYVSDIITKHLEK